jgi:hypothetical protein
MLGYLLGIGGLIALCAAWVLLQLWLQRIDPGYRGLQGGCGGCGDKRECKRDCSRETDG